MNRIILLDSGPLGMVTNPKATGTPLDCQLWLKSLLRRGERFAILEISDYEVRLKVRYICLNFPIKTSHPFFYG